MKRYAFIAGVFCLSCTFIQAQESNTPTIEVGANYSFVHVTSQGMAHYGENGGSAYAEYNLNKTVGIIADFGGYASGNFSRHSVSYLFGPRINMRMGRVVPYVQFLFGGVHEWGLTSAVSPTSPFLNSVPPVTSSPNGFATAAGVGLDVSISHHLAVKPFQAEYFMTQLPNAVETPNIVQNNLRYSAGVVFKFGEK